MTTRTVYRVQPRDAELHAIQTETSDGSPAGGVHVFGSLPEVWAVREWCEEREIELATIECDARDVRANGDYEGELLLAGRGRIVARRVFGSTSQLVKWVEKNT